jgi:acetyl esterase/lipase
MPSAAMQDLMALARDRQRAGASRAPATVAEARAAERLAEAGTAAGVEVHLEVGEGLPHVYQLALGTPEAAEATDRAGEFLRARVP